jgi:hypothetical protein
MVSLVQACTQQLLALAFRGLVGTRRDSVARVVTSRGSLGLGPGVDRAAIQFVIDQLFSVEDVEECVCPQP